MIAKLAVLFLVVMGALALIMGRDKKKRIGKTARRVPKPAEAVRCPDCKSWIVAGARCPCSVNGGGKRG